MLVRLALVALAAALVVVLSLRLADDRACEAARSDVFGAITGKARGDVARHVATIEERCRGSEALVATAGALRTAGDRRGALRLAREATRREPESFSAWRARGALERAEEQEASLRRAGELNPRWLRVRPLGEEPPADAGAAGP